MRLIKYFATRLALSALLLLISAQGVLAYVAVDFTNEMNGRTAAYAGATNIKLGEFTGPTPAVDTIIHNGATYVIAAGNALTAFVSGEKYLDTNNDSGFDTGEAVISSANTTLDSSDTVVTPVTGLLTAVPTSEGVGNPVFLDADADTAYDSGEAVAKIIVSGSAATMASGDVFETFPLANANTETSVMAIRSGTARINYDTPDAIIQYEYRDADSIRNLSILRAGSIGFTRFESADGVCLSDTDVNGAYSLGENFWYDIAGTCGTFNSGIDILLTSETATAPPYVNISDLNADLAPILATFAYSDADADGVFDCTRGAICEQMVYLAGSRTYPTGTTVSPGSTLGFISYSSTDLVDGAAVVAEAPAFVGADPDVVNFVFFDKALAVDGISLRYLYKDTDNDNVYDAEEDIIERTDTGTNGSTTVRFFPSGRAFADLVTDNDDFDDGEPVFVSADTTLSAGALNGGGTDQLIISSSSGFLDAFTSTEKYYDHDSSGAYADGDDVVNDTDGSGFYNADDLLTIQFANSISDHPIGNDDLDNLYVYKRVGGSCVGSGTDTLLGSITSSPFFDTNVTITDSAFTAATNYCIYADFLDSADAGEYLAFELSQNGADFASTGTSPSDAAVDFSLGEYIMSMSRYMDVTMVPDSVDASATTTYTSTFTTSATLDSADAIWIDFPDEYNVTGASIMCTDDGSASAGSSSINGQYVIRTLTTTITGGSVVACTVSGVRNPTAAGDYTDFGVYTIRNVDFDTSITADVDSSFSAITIASSGRHRSLRGGGVASPTVQITSPSASSTISTPARITWTTGGQPMTDVNLAYVFGGERHDIAYHASNNGSFTWNIPADLAGKEIDILVELTDLASIVATSEVRVTVPSTLPVESGTSSASTWQIPDLSAHLVKASNSPTVFYLGPDNLLRAFFNETLFKTWELSFADVRTLSPEELSQYQLGSGMVPLPGTVLVKSPIDAKVYVLEPNDLNPAQPVLHWITTEEVANAYFGDAWASKIIDVTPSIIVMSLKGSDLHDPLNPPWYIGLY